MGKASGVDSVHCFTSTNLAPRAQWGRELVQRSDQVLAYLTLATYYAIRFCGAVSFTAIVLTSLLGRKSTDHGNAALPGHGQL